MEDQPEELPGDGGVAGRGRSHRVPDHDLGSRARERVEADHELGRNRRGSQRKKHRDGTDRKPRDRKGRRRHEASDGKSHGLISRSLINPLRRRACEFFCYELL